MDAQTRFTPEGVLGLLHVAEIPTEVHQPGGVGFIELDTASEPVFAGHGDRYRRASSASKRPRAVPAARFGHEITKSRNTAEGFRGFVFSWLFAIATQSACWLGE
jgi:hypothetical protein